MHIFQLIAFADGLGTTFGALNLAYIGPGGGLSALGALLAIVAGSIIALFGFVWYPIKRILRNRKKRDVSKEGRAL